MKHLRFCFIAAILISGVLTSAWAGVKVIANSSVSASSISAEDLKGVFLLEKSSVGGAHVEPVLAKGGAAHSAFLDQYLSKTDAALQTYYRSLVFTGKASMPKTLASDAEVSAYVAKTKGAIGYVSDGASVDGVKTLDVK